MRPCATVTTILVAVLLLPVSHALEPEDAVIVTARDPGTLTEVQSLLEKRLQRDGRTVRRVELTGNVVADGIRIERASDPGTVLFAIGTDATQTALRAVSENGVVALGVANPARLRDDFTYVSVYPRYDTIFAYLSTRLSTRNVGFVYTPTYNAEVARAFFRASEGRAIRVVPIPVESPGAIVRALRRSLQRVDGLVLAIDPLVFDRRSVELIVSQAEAAGKPTVGFIPELTTRRVTVVLAVAPDAAVGAAVRAAEAVKVGSMSKIDAEDAVVIVSEESVRKLGLEGASLK